MVSNKLFHWRDADNPGVGNVQRIHMLCGTNDF
jgi:hypothetical protein